MQGLTQQQIMSLAVQNKEIILSDLKNERQLESALAYVGLEEANVRSTAATIRDTAAKGSNIVATEAQKASNVGLATSLKNLSAGFKATALAWLATPLGAITAISTVITGIVGIVGEYNRKLEENRQGIEDNAKKQSELTESLRNQIKTYDELNKRKLGIGGQEEAVQLNKELLSLQQGIRDTIGQQASNIDLVNGKYEEQFKILSNISREVRYRAAEALRSEMIMAKSDLQNPDSGSSIDWFGNTRRQLRSAGIDELAGYEGTAWDYVAELEISEQIDLLTDWQAKLNNVSDAENTVSEAIGAVSERLLYLTELQNKYNQAVDRVNRADAENMAIDTFGARNVDSQDEFLSLIDSINAAKTLEVGNLGLEDTKALLVEVVSEQFPEYINTANTVRESIDFSAILSKVRGQVDPLTSALAQQASTGEITRETYDAIVTSLSTAGVESEDYEKLIIKTADGYQLATDATRDFINTLVEQGIEQARASGQTEDQIDAIRKYYQDIQSLSANLANVKNKSDMLSSAKIEMSDLGHISNDTFQQLSSVTADISKYLYVQNGKLIFNAEAWNKTEGAVAAAEKTFKDFAKANPLGDRTEEDWAILQYLYDEWQRQTQGIETTTEAITRLNTELDAIQSAYSAVESAQKELNDEGYISIDTYQSLLEVSPKYLQLLIDEEGNLTLTKEALEAVTRARIEELAQKSVSAFLDTVMTYEDEAAALGNLKLSIDGVTGSLVELNAEMLKQVRLKFGDEVADLATSQLYAIDQAKNAALAGIGQGSGYSSSSSSSKKSTDPYEAEIEATMVLESQLAKVGELLEQNDRLFKSSEGNTDEQA
jgi:hypothetical protein